MLTYSEALEQVEEGGRPSIILGNGFSRAWRDDIFNYANLLEAANFGPCDVQIRALFQRLETYDFEAVMKCCWRRRKTNPSRRNSLTHPNTQQR